MASTIKVGVLGASGYSGMELVRLLSRHPGVQAPLLLRRNSAASASKTAAGPYSNGDSENRAELFSWSTIKQHGVEVLFLATPHDVSRSVAPEAVAHGLRVIDLSGAWRLKLEQNRAVYGFCDSDPITAAQLTDRAIYGLPELNADCIASAQLVANPGCYATSIILALAPLLRAGVVDRERGIISDSKSGVTGAGKEPTSRTHFVEVADNFSAYSVFGHRHTGEIVEQLHLDERELVFTPHLLPIPRGILSTIYLKLNREMQATEIEGFFREFYAGKPWIRIFPTPRLPQIKDSLHSNHCDLGFCLADDGRRLVLVSCLDNLLKGAAGQAVQNLNLMHGWSCQEGLQ